MVVVAVAGGTGAVGRNIIEALISQGKHQVIILSRTADAAKEKELGVRLVATDYKDVAILTKILEDNNVHTVISALVMMLNAGGPLEPNLIQAADASKTTRRMVPSEYGHPQREDMLRYWRSKPAKIWNGPYVMLIDIPENMAAMPGDGKKLVTFTHTSDVDKFVAASLDLPEWDRVSFIVGDKMTLNEAAELAQEAKALSTKFKVVYDDLDKLKRGEAAQLPSQTWFYSAFPRKFAGAICSTFRVWVDHRDLDLDESMSPNKKFPELKTMKLNEILEKACKN